MHLFTHILPFTYLLVHHLPLTTAVPKLEKKSWQEVPASPDIPQKLDGFQPSTDYSSRDPGGYSAGTEYPDVDYGQAYNGGNSGFDGGSNGYAGGNNGYAGGNNGYAGGNNGYAGGSSGYDGVNNGYGGGNNVYDGGNVGYGGNNMHNGGESYSNSFSESSSGYGDVMNGDGWDKNVKTVVKHVYKNIAVPHAVPTPVQVNVPKYVKYFKPFAVARPVRVPHIIPVIKHIQKPIPFFTALPIQQNVPVPKFIGLPVQVRVPRPVFIHVPKIVPVAKKYPVPVEVNIPKPYIVPIYKHVPVPVPHRVPKIINIVKEVPHYVKKPVPVYIDAHSGEYGGGNGFSGSGYTNNDYGNENHNGYASEEDNYYAGPMGHSGHQNNQYNNLGTGYNGGNDYAHHQTYNNAQDSMKQNSPYFYNRQKMQNFNQPKQLYPSNSYPRPHHIPNNQNQGGNSQIMLPNYYGVNQVPNINTSYGFSSNNPMHNGDVQSTNSQVQATAPNELYYQNANVNNLRAMPNPYNTPPGMPNSVAGYSQPVYNPSAYSEYTLSQQQYNQQMQYVQNNATQQPVQPNYSDSSSAQTTTTTTASPVMATEASNIYPNYQQHSYNAGFNINQQSNNFNSIPQMENYPNYNEPKPKYPHKSNFDFNNPFKQSNPYQTEDNKLSQWVSNFLQNSNIDPNNFLKAQQQHLQQQVPQVSSFFHQPPQNNAAFQKDVTHFNNPSNNGYNNLQNPQPQPFNYPENNQNNNFDNYVPSGSSHSSSSYSNSFSPPSINYQNMNNDNNAYKYNNEKFDQSPSQNAYSSTSNLAIPNGFSPSGQSVSYSNSGYGNDYPVSQDFSPQETRQPTSNANTDNSGSFKNANDDAINYPNSYSSNFAETSGFSPSDPLQMQNFNSDVSVQSGSLSDFSNSATNPQQENNQAAIPNIDYRNPQPQLDSLSSFVDSISSPSYSQPVDSSYTSSTSFSNSNSYSMTPESSYQSPVYSSPDTQIFSNNNLTSFNNNQPLITRPDVTTSYSYSYTQQETQPPPSYPASLYSNSYASDGQFKDIAHQLPNQFQPQTSLSDSQQSGSQINTAQSDQTYSASLSEAFQNQNSNIDTLSYGTSQAEPYPSYNPKVDEMDQHLQESASSIINVYTNSPDSKEAKKGQTFTFVDPASLESSQSPKYYLPPNPGTTSKNKYSNSDVQIIQAPSFNQDPNEPLQTSLDAYVPVQPVYYPPSGEQNTVYKEALTIDDTVYKEAVSLDSRSKDRTS